MPDRGLIPLMLSSPNATLSFRSPRRPSPSPSPRMRSPMRFNFAPAAAPAAADTRSNTRNNTNTNTIHKRNQSDMTPIIKLSRPPVRSSMKRQSQQLPASLPQIPYGSAEWKRAISEIKRYHVTRRYRACSARCNEILTNIKNIVSLSNVLYSIHDLSHHAVLLLHST